MGTRSAFEGPGESVLGGPVVDQTPARATVSIGKAVADSKN